MYKLFHSDVNIMNFNYLKYDYYSSQIFPELKDANSLKKIVYLTQF